MENPLECPVCHLEVRPTDYFCFNCGKNLRPKPLSTSLNRQIIIYLESFFLPPYGLIIGVRYLKQNDNSSKIVGTVAIILTVLSILIFVKVTHDLIAVINTQVNNQLQNMTY
jgi:hypothetical protein